NTAWRPSGLTTGGPTRGISQRSSCVIACAGKLALSSRADANRTSRARCMGFSGIRRDAGAGNAGRGSVPFAAPHSSQAPLAMNTAYDFSAHDIDGVERSLREFEGKALLIVNVASKCGFTPQYKGLEALWRRFHDKGVVVVGFPCDQFGHQEPGDEAE